MLQWNNLQVTPSDKLIVEVSVEQDSYFEDVYLDKIFIVRSKDFDVTGPMYPIEEIGTIDCEGEKYHRAVVDLDGVDDNLFFVYATSVGTPSGGAPCRINEPCIIGVAYNKQPLYQQGIKLLSSIGGCEPSNDLINYILTNKAFELNVDTGNFPQAIDNWNTLLNTQTAVTSKTSKCGCHG